MNEIYSLVLPQAPYVIAAYGILWVALIVYVGLIFRRLSGLEKQLTVVEETVASRRVG